MEQAIKVVFAVIAIAIAVVSIQKMMSTGSDVIKEQKNDQALNILKQNCDYTCTMNPHDSQVAMIQVSSGTLLYAEGRRICYNSSRFRCQLCACNLTTKIILNLTTDFALEAFDTHKYKCHIYRDANVTINCSG